MSLRQHPGRIGRRSRLAAAAACLLLSGVTALEDLGSAAAPRSASSRLVVVAARTLPAGHVLAAPDLLSTRAPTGAAVPRQPRRLTGRVLAGPVARGEPISALRLVDAALTTGLTPGTVALPVDVTTDVRGLVSPGGRIDLLAVPAGEVDGASSRSMAQRLAARVLVLAALPGASSSGDVGCRLVLAVTRDDALRIAGARATRLFQVAALPP